MVRAATFLVLFSSLTLRTQASAVDRIYMLSEHATICGPIRMLAQMDDTSKDLSALHVQRVRITLSNMNSTPIVLERVTTHYSNETPTSGAPFEAEIREHVGAGQEAVFVQQTTVRNPVSYVELNLVRYADGSSWHPGDGAPCKIVPEPLKR